MSGAGFSGKEYEQLLREGITAVKGGRREVAKRLLQRAWIENPNDARVWVWLSATTENPAEQRVFLEQALACDPGNAAALRGLAQLGAASGAASGAAPETAAPEQGDESTAVDEPASDEGTMAATRTFACPQCGGRMRFDADSRVLACEYCGHRVETPDELAADAAEAPLGAALHSGRAQRWAAGVHTVVCEQCGAHTVEPQGVKAQQCPYCGSNQLVESPRLSRMVDPQVVALFGVQEKEALSKARAWLNRGLFAPDDLSSSARTLRLRPAYYPFWTFDGSVEIHWSAEVRGGYGRSVSAEQAWRAESGVAVEFFDDVLVSGVSALKPDEVAALEPYNLKDVVAFDPQHLAGWPTLAYDRSLADASLLARERLLRMLRPRVRAQIAPGKETREVRIRPGTWTGVTYKHVLLPVWIGTYRYKGQEYHVLVNGQTGQVGGQKPKDGVKVAGIGLMAGLGIILIILLLTWLVLWGIDLAGFIR